MSDSPVLTSEQARAIWEAIATVERVRRENNYPSLFEGSVYANLAKSRLLGRILMDGRPPLDEMPPPYLSARGYHLVEPDLPHYYLGHSPVLVVVRKDPDDR